MYHRAERTENAEGTDGDGDKRQARRGHEARARFKGRRDGDGDVYARGRKLDASRAGRTGTLSSVVPTSAVWRF